MAIGGAVLSVGLLAVGFAYGFAAKTLDLWPANELRRLASSVWALSGLWREQHEPTVLPNGNLLVFDNRGHQGMSKVIELDPVTQSVEWRYAGTPENGFFTSTLGSSQRLPNGNTLITESNDGRAFEVTREGDLVWEFFNPARAGDDERLIAILCDTVRLPLEAAGWVEAES